MLVCAATVLSGTPRRLVVLGQPKVVVTANPKMGVHTRLTDEVEEWKIQESLAMVREMGARWVVEYFPWGYYEQKPGHVDWGHADLVIDHARNQGLQVVARIDFVPEWARPPDTTFRYLDREHFADYARFVAEFAQEYGGDVNQVIVWNEPNLAFEWGYRLPDPGAYADLLCQTYAAVKAAHPDMEVLMAGLAPTLAPPGSEWGMDDLLFLESVYAAGGGACFDALAVHAYGLTFPPDDPPRTDEINFRRAELLRQILVDHGDAHKRVFITEGGWNDHPRWTKAVRPYDRIVHTLRAYDMALNDWPWCEAVCLWAFRFPWPNKTYQDHYAFVTPEFIPKPVYIEARNYALDLPYEYLEGDPLSPP